MGCSPSKGQGFTGALEPSSSARRLLQEDQEEQEDSQPKREENTGNGDSACHLCEDTKLPVTCQERSPSPDEKSPTPVLLNSEETQEGENGIVFRQRWTQVNTIVEEQQGNAEETKSRKSEEGRHSEAEDLSLALFKADFRDRDLAQANPGAEGHISPSVSKYEALKDLLHQVTQTHQSLQPMTDLMAQRYEEINHQLEGMAEEGETALREHENNLARIQPADQLRRVIQYTSAAATLGVDSAGRSGYSPLEDAAVYFATLSMLLDEKLRAKRAAEQRLAQVVARVGAMGPQRKHAPEDGSLHSEDSGIGAESESLNGFERPQRHADNSELNRFEHSHQECNQSVSINSNCKSAGDRRSLNGAKRATSLGNIAPHWLKQGMEQKPKSLQMVTSTGTKRSPPVISVLRRSWSEGSLCHQTGGTTLPQQCHCQQPSRTMGEPVSRAAARYSVCSQLNKEFEQEGKQVQQPVPLPCIPSQKKTSHCSRARLRRHSSQELEMDEKEKKGDVEGRAKGSKGDRGALRAKPPLRARPSPAHVASELYSNSSVKRLINTFNCRGNSNQSHNPSNVSVISQGARKYGAPNKPGKTESCGTISNCNWQEGFRTYTKVEDSDVDPLPPPPPEVLMDNSFSRTDKSPDQDGMQSRACAASQHMHSSRQKVTPPSSRCGLHHQDTVAGSWARPDSLQESERDPKKEQADDPYHRDHKIIYLQDSAESSMNTFQTGQDQKIPLSLGSRVGTQGGSDGHGDTTVLPVIGQPVTNPAISRKLKSSFQNLPRTPVVSQLSIGSPEASSSALFNLPPLPSGQTGFISLASSPQSIPSAGWKHDVSHEDRRAPVPVESMSFQDAAQRETWITSQSATLLRPWGESPCTKLPLSAYSPRPFVRRCLSDRKPTGSPLARMSLPALSKVNQSQSRESALGLEYRPVREEELCDMQQTLRDTNRTLPENCIMGQAMVSNCKETDEGGNRITD